MRDELSLFSKKTVVFFAALCVSWGFRLSGISETQIIPLIQ